MQLAHAVAASAGPGSGHSFTRATVTDGKTTLSSIKHQASSQLAPRKPACQHPHRPIHTAAQDELLVAIATGPSIVDVNRRDLGADRDGAHTAHGLLLSAPQGAARRIIIIIIIPCRPGCLARFASIMNDVSMYNTGDQRKSPHARPGRMQSVAHALTLTRQIPEPRTAVRRSADKAGAPGSHRRHSVSVPPQKELTPPRARAPGANEPAFMPGNFDGSDSDDAVTPSASNLRPRGRTRTQPRGRPPHSRTLKKCMPSHSQPRV